jgi:hypothetical protein
MQRGMISRWSRAMQNAYRQLARVGGSGVPHAAHPIDSDLAVNAKAGTLVNQLADALVDRELDGHVRQAAARGGSWRSLLSRPVGATER